MSPETRILMLSNALHLAIQMINSHEPMNQMAMDTFSVALGLPKTPITPLPFSPPSELLPMPQHVEQLVEGGGQERETPALPQAPTNSTREVATANFMGATVRLQPTPSGLQRIHVSSGNALAEALTKAWESRASKQFGLLPMRFCGDDYSITVRNPSNNKGVEVAVTRRHSTLSLTVRPSDAELKSVALDPTQVFRLRASGKSMVDMAVPKALQSFETLCKASDPQEFDIETFNAKLNTEQPMTFGGKIIPFGPERDIDE